MLVVPPLFLPQIAGGKGPGTRWRVGRERLKPGVAGTGPQGVARRPPALAARGPRRAEERAGRRALGPRVAVRRAVIWRRAEERGALEGICEGEEGAGRSVGIERATFRPIG